MNSYGSDVAAVEEIGVALESEGPSRGDKRAGGWSSFWERTDGLPCLVSADLPSREVVDNKGYTDLTKLFGYFPMFPVMHNGRVVQRARGKVEILQAFVNDVDPRKARKARELLAALYRPAKYEAARTYPCVCDAPEFGTRQALQMHQYGCAVYLAQTAAGAEPATGSPSSPAFGDAPAATYTCKQCGQEGFTSTGSLGYHTRSEHPKPKRTRKRTTSAVA